MNEVNPEKVGKRVGIAAFFVAAPRRARRGVDRRCGGRGVPLSCEPHYDALGAAIILLPGEKPLPSTSSLLQGFLLRP
jgi:hypothetical protein